MFPTFRITPSPKQLSKLNPNFQEVKPFEIPQNWSDFARLSDISSQGVIQKFEPFCWQIEISELMDARSCIFIKGRQLGLTEMVLSKLVHRACLNRGYVALVFSKTQQDSSNLAMRAKRALEGIGVKLETDNLRDLIIRNGGRLRFLNSKPESSRSAESVTDILYDECSFVPDLAAIRDAATPTQAMLGDKAREYLISTPNGAAGLYFDMANSGNDRDIRDICKDVVIGNLPPFHNWTDVDGWEKIVVHWKAHPIYSQNPNYIKDIHTRRKTPMATLEREHNLSFTEAESSYFNPLVIERCQRQGVLQKSGIVSADPSKRKNYFIGVDPNNGGDNYWSVTVVQFDNGVFTKVFGYRRAKQTMEYHLFHLYDILKKFPGILTVELNSIGKVLYETIQRDKPSQKIVGVTVTNATKRFMCERLKFHLETEKFVYEIKDSFIDDALNFREVGEQLEAAYGKFDDCVSSAYLTLEGASQNGFL